MLTEPEILARLFDDHRAAQECARALAVASSITHSYGAQLRALAAINKRLEGSCRQMAVLQRGDARWLMAARVYNAVQRKVEEMARPRLIRIKPPPGTPAIPQRWAKLAEIYEGLACKVAALAERKTGRPGTGILPRQA